MDSDTDNKEQALKAKEWVQSEAGKQRLAEILQLTKAAEARLATVRKVDPKSLKKPITR